MIDKVTLDAALRESLNDRKLSKPERFDLVKMMGKQALTAEERAFVRNRVFSVAKECAAKDGEDNGHKLLAWSQDVIKAVERNRQQQVEFEAHFSPGEDSLATIQRLLRCSQTSVDICVFTITDNRIREAIVACANRKLDVRVISDNDKSFDTGSDIEHLRSQGVAVRLDRSEHHMHHKFAIFDRTTLLSGSYNWTRSAAAVNRENILVCNDGRALDAFQKEFDGLWKAFA